MGFISILFCALAVLYAASATAHQGGTTGYATITVSGQTVRYKLTLSAIPKSPLAEAMGLGQPNVAPKYGRLVEAIAEKIHLTNNGEACEAVPGHVIPPTPSVVSVTGIVDFACPGTMGTLAIRDDLFDVLGSDLHTLAKIGWPGGTQQFAFSEKTRETRAMVAGKAGAARGAGSFFTLGIEHMLTGYDHLLFLLALILCGGGLLRLLKIITGFTVAHSITLALAVLDVVNLPGRLVEAVIALSIAYVAAENLFPRYAISRRWAVSFVFGLMHGFGFSSVLKQIGLPRDNLALSLLNFNLGVEVGQAAVVLVTVPILIWLRKTDWEPRFAMVVSGAVLAVGLGLFVERVFLWD